MTLFPSLLRNQNLCVCVCVCGWVGGWVGGCVCVCVCDAQVNSNHAPTARFWSPVGRGGGGGGGGLVAMLSAAGGASWPLATYPCPFLATCAFSHSVLLVVSASCDPHSPALPTGSMVCVLCVHFLAWHGCHLG